MVTLYIASSEPYAGKTLTAIVLGTRWQRQGRKVGYMKPLGLLPVRVGDELTDEDAYFVAERLNLESAPSTLCPILMTRETCHMPPEEAKEKVRAAYEAASAGVDVMIVSGTGSVIKRGSMIGLNGVTASTMLDAKVLLVGKCESFTDADSIVAARQALGDRVVGVFVNMVPPRIKEQMWDDVVPCLEKSGLKVLGMMPMDPILHSVSVAELAEATGGEFLCGAEGADELVENFIVNPRREICFVWIRAQRFEWQHRHGIWKHGYAYRFCPKFSRLG